MNRRLLLAAVAAAGMATGCSRLGVGWRVAPFWLRHETSRWLGVDAAEKPALNQDVDAYLRRLALRIAPRAAAWSRHLGKLVAAGQDQAAVDGLFDDGTRLWASIKEEGVQPAARWLSTRPQARLEALRKGFDEEIRSEGKRAPGPKEAADRAKRLREGLTDWMGALTEAQEDRLDGFIAKAEYPFQALQAERRRREQALQAAVQSSAPGPAVERQLRDWWVTPEHGRDPACAAALDGYRKGLKDTLLGLLKSMTPDQRDYLARRLNALAEDLDAIYQKAARQ